MPKYLLHSEDGDSLGELEDILRRRDAKLLAMRGASRSEAWQAA